MDTWDPLLTILQELDTTTAIMIKSHSCAMMGYYQSASTQIVPDIKVDRPRPAIIVVVSPSVRMLREHSPHVDILPCMAQGIVETFFIIPMEHLASHLH